ncbi:hypothetical protein BOTBODRAFT_178606 [Botryobasidium botryosum FD-172 SS1]|uniref:Tcp11-domain-containing protein n=1 Tax=Botryobasidium botryosum (strain FD-172 SS1) TaxID=930990 RepID=A0A067M2V3_BOTB1|nr:hypothetical protein BOTBODRAFT_178606 [Botryobasidium botryosum FD-172 SS1]
MDLDRDSRPPQTSSAISPVSVPAQLSPPPSPTKQKSATGSAKGSSEGLLVASALHATHPTASSALQGSPPPPQTAVGTSAEKPLALSLKLGASTSDLSFSSNDLPSPSFCPVPPPPPPTPVLCHPYQSLALAALAPPHALPASLSATVSHHTLIQPHIPSLHPLITRETLKELDLEAILRNPQLRHDLLFDPGLQFRPTSGRRKRDATEKYWIAVQREVEEGCTCTCFDDVGHVYECVCATSSCGMRAPVTIRMPSRIPPLIAELLEVLLSVISPAHPPSPSTASAPLPSPNGPAPAPAPVSTAAAAVSTTSSSSSAQTNLAHAALRAALDPVLISQELSHGVLDPASLFRYIGDTLKCHCAPMRDCLVERMVEVASTEGVGKRGAVKALRMCFEILELMKLDIANHQLQALRPYLLETSVDFELKTFHDRYERGLITLHQTRDWLRAAHRRLCESAIARKAPKLRTINLALCEGLVELVFAPPASPTSPPPSPTPSSSSSSSSGSSVSGSGSHRSPLVLPPGYPETLYLDHSRLTSLMTDASDLTALYMLLLLYRQLVFSTASGTKTKARIEDREIDRVKREVWEVGPARLGLCFFKGNGSGSGGHGHHHGKHSTSSSSSSSSSSAGRSAVNAGGAVVVDETVKWRREMKDVVLQVAVRAEEAREGLSASRSTPSSSSSTSASLSATGESAAPIVPKQETLDMLDRWTESNFKNGSPIQKIMKTRLRNAVLTVVREGVLGPSAGAGAGASASASASANANSGSGSNDGGSSSPSSAAGTGLEPLMPEIQHLGERMTKLVQFHSRVYRGLYEADGFLEW